jgi:hypothetical protein
MMCTERRRNIGDPPDRAALAENCVERFGAFNAVLEREDVGAGLDDRFKRPRRRLGVGQLDAEKRCIRRRGLGRVGDATRRMDAKVAQKALHDEAVAADRLAMRAARDECHVRAASGEFGAEIAADAAGPHHHDPHGRPSKITLTSHYARMRPVALRGLGRLIAGDASAGFVIVLPAPGAALE